MRFFERLLLDVFHTYSNNTISSVPDTSLNIVRACEESASLPVTYIQRVTVIYNNKYYIGGRILATHRDEH